MFRFFTLIASLVVPTAAYSYPNTIGYGYTSCSACHYNPLGNGPLTDYGRAVSATVIAARPFYLASNVTEEQLTEYSGFLGKKALPSWIRPSIDYRGIDLRTGIGSEQSLNRWINMQAEGSLVLKGLKDRLVLVGTLGMVPVPSQVPKQQRAEIPTWISREHYIGYRPVKNIGIYVGMMDPVFGIRVPDHNAYLRSKSFNDKNDQSHGVMLHVSSKKWDAALQAMAGNMFQWVDLRQKGLTGLFEHDVAKDWRLGVSGWITEGVYRSRQMVAVQSRAGVSEGSSLLIQAGTIREDPISARAKTGLYSFTQMTTRMTRGLNLMLTFEYYTEEITQDVARFYRVGPSFQWFPMQRLEFRADLLGSRKTGVETLDPDVYTLQTQVHVWL